MNLARQFSRVDSQECGLQPVYLRRFDERTIKHDRRFFFPLKDSSFKEGQTSCKTQRMYHKLLGKAEQSQTVHKQEQHKKILPQWHRRKEAYFREVDLSNSHQKEEKNGR